MNAHWYGPLVEAEHKVAHYIAADFTRTGKDISRLEKAFRAYERRNPNAAMLLEGAAFMALLLSMLAVQAWYSYSRL